MNEKDDLTFKKIIKYTIIFVLLCILIYSLPNSGVINVNAKTFDYSLIDPYVYLVDKDIRTFSSSSLPFDNNRYYYIPEDYFNTNRVSLSSLSYEISFNDRNYVYSYFKPEDLVYVKGIIKFTSHSDISLVKNFSYISNLSFSSEKIYNLYIGYNSSPNYLTIEDFDMYITIDENGEYAYNEVILFSKVVPFSQISNHSSLNIGVGSQGSSSSIVKYGETSGTIKLNPKNYVEMNQLIISDEEIDMTLEDFKDTSGLIQYNPDDVSFPPEEEDEKDTFLSKLIDRFISGIRDPIIDSYKRATQILLHIFIPEKGALKEGWLRNYNLFEEQLGILFLPFEIIEDILNKYLTLGEGDGIIKIPTIKDPIYNQTIISAQNYNLKQIFSTGSLKSAHNTYLVVIDGIIVLSLISLALKKFNSIFKSKEGGE